MRTCLVVAGLLALAGCSNKKDRETAAVGAVPTTPTTTTSLQPAAGSAAAPGMMAAGSANAGSADAGSSANPGSAGAGSSATAEAPVPAAAGVQALGCAKSFPQALVDKYYRGATVEDVTASSGSSGTCKLTLADQSTVTITAMCWDTVPATAMATSFDHLKQLGTTPPTRVQVGKSVEYTPTSPTRNTVVAWDDNAPCSISADLPTNVAVEPWAKDALATFPAK